MKSTLHNFLEQAGLNDNAPFVVTPDLVGPLGLDLFREQSPGRLLDVGICEQAMIGVAAGLASLGQPVIAATFATFMLRAFEIIRNLIVLDQRSVVLVGAHAGLATGPNGATHQAVEDIGAFRLFPSMRILLPSSTEEGVSALGDALYSGKPSYVRLSRWVPEYPFGGITLAQPERGIRVYAPVGSTVENCDVYIYAHGATWPIARNAVDLAAAEGIKAAGVQIYDVTESNYHDFPSGVVTVLVEDATETGGLKSFVVEKTRNLQILHIGARWPIGSDDGDRLYERSGLFPRAVLIRILDSLEGKRELWLDYF